MADDASISRNLKLRQDAFFRACERAGLSLAWFEAETGIPRGTLGSYKSTPSREPAVMGLSIFVRLIKVLPPDLTHLASLLIEDSGCFIARTDARSAAWLELGEKAGALAAKVCRYQASDGHIDHREDADLRADVIEIVSGGHGILGGTGS